MIMVSDLPALPVLVDFFVFGAISTISSSIPFLSILSSSDPTIFSRISRIVSNSFLSRSISNNIFFFNFAGGGTFFSVISVASTTFGSITIVVGVGVGCGRDSTPFVFAVILDNLFANIFCFKASLL